MSDHSTLHSILEFCSAHFTEEISLETVAASLHLSRCYISHLFSQTLKTTLPEYVHSLRLSDAARLLRQTDQNVTRIALDLGFGSLRNFNRVFLKQIGMTPTEYRQSKA